MHPADKGRAINPSHVLKLASLFLTGIASAGLLALKPLIVGALIDDYHFSASQAGFVAGIEMAGIGIASFVAATVGGTWNRRLVIVIGATLGILGSITPALTDDYVPILLTRFVAGFGCGLIAANVLAVIGTTRDPDRTFGLYYMTTYVCMALLVPAGIWALARGGVAGGYILLALLLVAVYVMVLQIPGTVTGFRGKGSPSPFPWVGGTLSLSLSLVFWVGVGAVWAFVERIGVDGGISKLVIGSVMTMGPVASIAGALTASILHIRLGRGPLLAASISLAIIAVAMIGLVGSATSYTAGFLIFSYVWPLFLAYLGGAMAVVDPAGRVVAMSVASQTIGMAIGPAIGGMVAGHFGYIAISILGIVSFAIAFPILGALLMRIRQPSPAT